VILTSATILLIGIAVAASWAQGSPLATPLNSTEKIHITADTLEADNKDNSFVFRGKVKVVQGETEVTSDALLIRYRPETEKEATEEVSPSGKIEIIEATGNVIILFEGRTAKSDKAIYDGNQETLQLIGEKSTVIDGPNTISGSKITLYRNEDRIKVESSRDNRKDRVTAIIFPDKMKSDEVNPSSANPATPEIHSLDNQ
jgi:lipopolysaccharide export system protein LptA